MDSLLQLSKGQKSLLVLAAAFFLIMGGIIKMREFNFVGKSPDFQPTIYVSGEGKVQAVPDVAKITFGYTVTKPSTAEAQKENTDKMNAFVAAIKKEGVDDKDIQTTNFNIYPEYNYVDGRQVPRGFTVSQNVEVTLRDTSKAQRLIQLAGEQNLNQVSGLNFVIDNPQKYIDEARAKALKQAKENAASIARNAGFRLGRLMNYSENTQPASSPVYAYGKGGVGGATDAAVPAPTIAPGSNEIYVQVSLNYEIKQ